MPPTTMVFGVKDPALPGKVQGRRRRQVAGREDHGHTPSPPSPHALIRLAFKSIRLMHGSSAVTGAELHFTVRSSCLMFGDSEAGAGQAAKLRFSGRLRRLPCGARSRGPVAQLAARTGVRYAQTVATSQCTKRAKARGPRALRSSAPNRRIATCPAPASRQRWACSTQKPTAASRRVAPGRGDLCGDEEHSPGVGARTRALRQLTCRSCLSVARKRVASSAARPRGDAPSPDTNSPEDCLCLARDRDSGPGRSAVPREAATAAA